jgi:5-methylcytosine-specific restriction enzyme subunit McrC
MTMRTIELREQQTTPCVLSRREVTLLAGAQRLHNGRVLSVRLRSGEDDVYDLRTGSVVGTLVWPGMQVLIRPKIDMENVFFLLGFRGGLAQWRDEAFPYEREPNFLRALAWAFDAEVRRALRYGIARDYLAREDTLVAPRGRIDLARQFRVRQDRAFPVECQFQEYTEDIPLNRLIKAANRRLRGVPGLGDELARRLGITMSAFTDVSAVGYSPASIPELTFTRLNRRWESAARMAALILRQEALRDRTGIAVGTSFTVDMNLLFEKFVEEVVHEEAGRAGLELQPQAPVRLTDRVIMFPDLVLRSRSQRVAVGDAKYIEVDPTGWPNANLYQLLAYCTALGLPRGLLIYAGPRPLDVQQVKRADVELEVMGIDISGRPEQVLAHARTAARRLVAHAHMRGATSPQIHSA